MTKSGKQERQKYDAYFLCCFCSKEDGYVVTGNTKHFPKSPIVVTPAEMMQIVQGTNK